VLNGNGVMLSQTDYAPFGNELWQGGNATERRSWIGKEQDNESELGDFGVRKYDDDIGRFLSVDALWEVGISWTPYHYSYNNPIGLKDETGLVPGGTPGQNDTRERPQSPTDIGAGGGPQVGVGSVVRTAPRASVGNSAGGSGSGTSTVGENTKQQEEANNARNTASGQQLNAQSNTSQSTTSSTTSSSGSFGGTRSSGSPSNTTSTNTTSTNTNSNRGTKSGENVKSAESNPEQWKSTSAHTEEATGRRTKGGTSVQTVKQNVKSGETVVKHDVVDKDGKSHESHYRPDYKRRIKDK